MATWLITGCSTGLGRALATAVLDRGENVVVTARDASRAEDLARSHPGTALALPLDATDHAQISSVVRAAQERFGAIDVLVNNAGHGYRAAVGEAVADQVQELFATIFGRGAQLPRRNGTLRGDEGGPGGAGRGPAQGGRAAGDHRHDGRAQRVPHQLQALPRPASGRDKRLCRNRGRPPQGRPHRGCPSARRPGQGSPGDHDRRPEPRHAVGARPRVRRAHLVSRRR